MSISVLKSSEKQQQRIVTSIGVTSFTGCKILVISCVYVLIFHISSSTIISHHREGVFCQDLHKHNKPHCNKLPPNQCTYTRISFRNLCDLHQHTVSLNHINALCIFVEISATYRAINNVNYTLLTINNTSHLPRDHRKHT